MGPLTEDFTVLQMVCNWLYVSAVDTCSRLQTICNKELKTKLLCYRVPCSIHYLRTCVLHKVFFLSSVE
jgi:hypothetical protein